MLRYELSSFAACTTCTVLLQSTVDQSRQLQHCRSLVLVQSGCRSDHDRRVIWLDWNAMWRGCIRSSCLALMDVSEWLMEICRLLRQLEARARQLEGRELGSGAAQARGKADLQRYDRDRQGANPALLTVPTVYNADADITADVRADVVKEKKKVQGSRL